MKLLTKDLPKRLPPLYSREGQGKEAIAAVRFFARWADWAWYATEYNPEQRLFFGLVVGQEREFGYFSLDELEAIRSPGGLRIERDLFWRPRPLKECR